ncbi:MAG: thioredoxin fold domain-containing protein [Cytophagales bacterium]|nr:thioredoxin fold domain-containing protein [Bernardetiaceae bacterium]MDW8209650.1 thioredoxin fold domain-containing protein [Cytophagales bacterium]
MTFVIKPLFLLAQGFSSTPTGIQFQKYSWIEVLKHAKASNKYIFVSVYAEWCAPCKKMHQEVFTNLSVANFFNNNFVNFRINAEEGEGIEFSSVFEVDAYPSALFFSPEGKLVHRLVGYFDAEAFLQGAKNALNPDYQLVTLKNKYESGDRSQTVMRQYVYALLNAGDSKASSVARELLQQQTSSRWHEPDNWALIQKTELDINSPVFDFVAKNPHLFAIYEPEYSHYIHLVTGRAMFKVSRSQQLKQLQLLKQVLKHYFPKDSARYLARADFYFYTMGNHDEKKYAASARYLDHYCNDWQELNEIAWSYYEQETSLDKLQKALQWVEKSIQLKETYSNLETKAHLLYKLGRSKEALEVAQKAISIGRLQKLDTSLVEELISIIRQTKR